MSRTRSNNSNNTLPENLHKASLTQLNQLSKESLCLNLESRGVMACGTKEKLAQILFNVVHKTPSPENTRIRETRLRRRATIKRDVFSEDEECKMPRVNSCSKKRPIPETAFILPTRKTKLVIQKIHEKKKTSTCPTVQLNQSPPQTSHSLARSMPPLLIPSDIRDSIVRGQFVDFTQLLSRVIFAKTNQSSSLGMTNMPLEITCFADWMEAWNNYVSVIVAHTPSRALEMIGYQKIITSANSQVPFFQWSTYDIEFCMLASFNHDLRWDTRHQDLWLQCMVIDEYKQDHEKYSNVLAI